MTGSYLTFQEILFSGWHMDIPAIVISVLLLSLYFYMYGFRFTHKASVYFSGIVLLILTACSPLDFLSHYLFSAHMFEHVIFLLVVPPLILSGSDPGFIEKVLAIPLFRQAGKFILNPFTAWISGVGIMWIWHIPQFYNYMMHSEYMHTLSMIIFLAFGLVFIWPVYSPVRSRRLEPLQRAVYLFTACVGCTVLGIMITFAPAGLYNHFMTSSFPGSEDIIRMNLGVSDSVDQQAGGLVMWVPACFVYLTNIMITILKWLQSAETEESLN